MADLDLSGRFGAAPENEDSNMSSSFIGLAWSARGLFLGLSRVG